MNEFEKLVGLLRKNGWKEQKAGSVYFNGTVGTNFIKNGELLHVSVDDWPDEEVVEELFGEVEA